MANWKKIGGGVAVLALVAAGGAGWWAYDTLNTARSDVADDSVTLATFKADPEAVTRGEYVMRTGDCAACHTKGNGAFAGGYEIATPFGVLVSSNITPDSENGIGNMTERDFFNALRQGIGQHGLLYPAMPYTAYKNLSDQDMRDLWAYMSTVEPVAHDIDETAGMRFPFNIRLAMAGWDMLFFDNEGFTPASDDAVLARGQYIVDGGGHCSACHSPRNLLSGEVASQYLQGGNLGTAFAPDITSNEYLGVGTQSVESIAEYLRTGTNGVEVAAGPMAEAIEHSLQYLSDEDLTAVATYLKSVPGSDVVAPEPLAAEGLKRGALEYEVSCAACHGPQGEGMGLLAPAFAGNAAMLAPDITNLSHALMVGGRAVASHENPTGAGMPSFAWKYSDAQMAEILDYVRNSWGNAAPPVDVEDIAKMRAASQAREKLAIPQ